MTDDPPLTARRAGPGDAGVVLALVREIAAHEGDVSDVRSTAGTWAAMLDRPDVLVLLAERAGEPVGYVSAVRRLHLWLGTDVLALDDLFVRDGHRDAGVGRFLMTELARLATAEDLVVRWEVRVDNTAAQRLYRRLGARLWPKIVAWWPPEAQRVVLGD
ncbi:GNAT family N-acetyltransferase [Geodermatophilus nigrescens]|uniref:Acetyltransferase (GNAT) family protein n=1 Tax=Geodermatophilus nigrescens TaxID=1070870 RepID=A0A1M5QRX9_9ACTN|nr:GNAT family N-acetyltransferase [Geodermatophilus nigrescens]SHH16867.1 Acetyltransferase (GNAT) family protein [Geodermatophilus nigrescens]